MGIDGLASDNRSGLRRVPLRLFESHQELKVRVRELFECFFRGTERDEALHVPVVADEKSSGDVIALGQQDRAHRAVALGKSFDTALDEADVFVREDSADPQ